MNTGSEWSRWDMHIHTPYTNMADQFIPPSWDRFIEIVNSARPAVSVLGITDYLSIDNYITVREQWEEGKYPFVKMVIPNVEYRITIQTDRQQSINMHFLFSPDDPDHIAIIKNKLALLSFNYEDQNYACDRSSLIRLGKSFDSSIKDEQAAFVTGVNQFKLEFSSIQSWYDDKWIKENCLIALSAGRNDGTSGLQRDSSYAAMRKNLEAFAHIIFSGNHGDREFWLGRGSVSEENLLRDYRGAKPCLFGSDAHKYENVLKPTDDKYCWIKAEPTFNGFRQILFEPENRVFIGPECPSRPQKHWIKSIEVPGRAWFPQKKLFLNEGLVSIIGARGSGKTALEDLIACGADSYDDSNASFIRKAYDYVSGSEVILEWADSEEKGTRTIGTECFNSPSVRYLSQQFVEQLCSGDGSNERLNQEIENVIFDSIDETDRAGATSFDELRATLTQENDIRLQELKQTIRECSRSIAAAAQERANLPQKKQKLQEVAEQVKKIQATLTSYISSGTVVDIESLNRLQKQEQDLEANISSWKLIERKLREKLATILANIKRFDNQFDEEKKELVRLGIKPAELGVFRIGYQGDVGSLLERVINEKTKEIQKLTDGSMEGGIEKLGINRIRKKIEEITKKVAKNEELRTAISQLQGKLKAKQQEESRLLEEIKKIETTDLKEISEKRLGCYVEQFDEITKQINELKRLYAPLSTRLASSEVEQQKLEFDVGIQIDVQSWIEQGESLFDLRKIGPLQGRGSLKNLIDGELVKPWSTGDKDQIQNAMRKIVESFKGVQSYLLPTTNLEMFAEWLFSTEHIQVKYCLKYEGISIEKLSPGNKGIVLLILFLALDRQDDRPLLIDQPEENLDPESIYKVLTGFFRDARKRRQIIMITHNPNLVVNTDSDLVLVAQAQRTSVEELPMFTYQAGGIEDPIIRGKICAILEGGEKAFKQRERRYLIKN